MVVVARCRGTDESPAVSSYGVSVPARDVMHDLSFGFVMNMDWRDGFRSFRLFMAKPCWSYLSFRPYRTVAMAARQRVESMLLLFFLMV
jgi:hypothetical protein